MAAKDLTGMTFGSWTVIGFSRFTSYYAGLWSCVCKCGRRKEVHGQNLTNGKSTQCKACKARKHGGYGSREYNTWESMKQRCFNSNSDSFKGYGGRGIRVCSRWMEFANFFEDMGPRPKGREIDRIDNDGNYEPGNCRWATKRQQNRNKRPCHYIAIEGVTRCVTEWAEIVGIHRSTIFNRLSHGWDPEKAVLLPTLSSWAAKSLARNG